MDESPPTEGAWRDIPLRPLEIIAAKGCPATLRLVNSEWRDAVNRSLTELRLKQAVKVSRILTVKEKFPRVQHLKMVLDDRVLSQDDPICTSLHATGEVGMISDSVARNSMQCDGESLDNNVKTIFGLLSKLDHLRKLTLRPSKIPPMVLDIRQLTALTGLSILDMSGGRGSNFQHLSSIKELTALELSKCHISEQDVQEFSSLRNLTHLGLGSARLHATTLHKFVRQLSGLTYLDLNNTRVVDDSLRQIRSLSLIQHLNLAFTQIGDDGMYYLRDLTKMTHLSLRATCVSDSGIVHILSMSRLEVLILAGSYIGDAGLQNLPQLGSLRFLNVVRLHNASEEGVMALNQILPSVRILSVI